MHSKMPHSYMYKFRVAILTVIIVSVCFLLKHRYISYQDLSSHGEHVEQIKSAAPISLLCAPFSSQWYPLLGNETTKFAMNLSFFDDYRLTRIQNPAPQLGQRNVGNRGLRYQCAGDDYEAYVQKIAQVANAKLTMGDMNWGRRESWLLPNQKILLLGHSHTRQVSSALRWQYEEQVTSERHFDGGGERYGSVHTYQNGARVFTFWNIAHVYSPRWQTNLEELMNLTFSQLDIIGLGPTHTYKPEWNKASMWTAIQNIAEFNPRLLINVTENRHGPTISDLMDVYSGNIVYIPSFATSMDEYNTSIALASQRSNMRVVRTRLFMEAIGGDSCGHDDGKNVSRCLAHGNNHQCMGEYGGVPDVVGWDLTEILLELVEKDSYYKSRFPLQC